jgi:hypothetical protein
MAPCSLVEIYRGFEGAYCLRLQSGREAARIILIKEKGRKAAALLANLWQTALGSIGRSQNMEYVEGNVYEEEKM